MPDTLIARGTPQGRWVLAAAVLGSGMALLDGTVVNIALRNVGDDLDASLAQLQWVVNAYLFALASLILVVIVVLSSPALAELFDLIWLKIKVLLNL